MEAMEAIVDPRTAIYWYQVLPMIDNSFPNYQEAEGASS
jgi:hypothetical protein